jgi:Tol biopolymer transport system component/DNA-binding winged helix-turn-helix (wHTH) protein
MAVAVERNSVRFGPFRVDLKTQRLYRDQIWIKLPRQSFLILKMLLARPGEVVTREELRTALWPSDTFVDFDHGLNNAVNRIRVALNDGAEAPTYIETLPRVGYRFVGQIPTNTSGEPEAASAPTVASEWTRDFAHFNRRRALWVIAVLVVLAAAFLSWQWPEPAPVLGNYKQITYDGQRKGDGLATDGQRVYFPAKTPEGYAIAQVSSNGGAAVLLATSLGSDLRLLDLSPDGSELLVLPSSQDDSEEQLYAISVPDGAPRRISDVTATSAGWSPDGQYFVYVHGNALFTASRIGADVRKIVELPDPPYQPRISPDGSIVRFVLPGRGVSHSELWDINIDGTGLHQVLPNWNKGQAEGNWTRDGRYFLFNAWANGRLGIWAVPRRATLLNPHSKPVLLTPGNSNITLPVQSPDGKKLFVSVGTTRMEVMRFQAESGKFVPHLPISGTGFNFTHDGQHVIYTRLPGFDLIRSRIDGSEQVKLLQGSSLQMVRWGRLSPDEKQIAVAEGTNNVGIYLVPTEGGKPELVLSGHYLAPDWSPDGNSLVFRDVTQEPSSLGVVDLRTKKASAIPESQDMWRPRWSTDGRYIAAIRLKDGAVVLFDFEKQQWRKASDGRSDYPAWSPDGRYLYFVSLQGTANAVISEQSLYRYEIRSGKQELVTSLRDLRHDTLEHFISWIGFAPDGSVLALRDNTTVDIYSLDWIAP